MIRQGNNTQSYRRYHQLRNRLIEEQPHWISRSNINSKIIPSLFLKPLTTGLTTKTSNFWRLHPIAIRLDRKLNVDAVSEKSFSQRQFSKRLMVQAFLDPMIATGDHRANYSQLVEEFLQRFENLDALEEDESYFEVIKSYFIK